MLLNRRVCVSLYYGELYEGILRKSEMPGFIHLEQRGSGKVQHKYIPLDDIMSFWYSANGRKNVYEVQVESRFKKGY